MPCINHPEVVEGLAPCSRCGQFLCPDCAVTIKNARYCAACKTEFVKDIQSGVDPTQLPLAGIGRRFAALWLDGLILSVVYLPLVFATGAASFSRNASQNSFTQFNITVQIIGFCIYLLYEGIFLHWRGQTLGKMALKIKVVTADGRDLRPGQAWLRPLVRNVMGFALFGLAVFVDYLPAVFTKQKTCLHDMAARTRVIKLQ